MTDYFVLSFSYAIVYKKGYQEHDTALSAVTTKLKGTAVVNFTGFDSPLLNGVKVFDPADYVVPPQVYHVLCIASPRD